MEKKKKSERKSILNKYGNKIDERASQTKVIFEEIQIWWKKEGRKKRAGEIGQFPVSALSFPQFSLIRLENK